MRPVAALLLLSLLSTSPVQAQEDISLQSLYVNPQGKKLPEIIIFYNTDTPCENCHQTIDMIIEVLRRYYRQKIHAYLINTADHPEYRSAFKLTAPLTLIVIRISDGAAFGYAKLSGLQSKTMDKSDFSRQITEFINNFLGF